jgi:segregation and condensation protein B
MAKSHICRDFYFISIHSNQQGLNMELSVIIPHIEALIFASEKPLTTLDLVELVNNALGFMEERATLDQVESAMEAIREKYSSEFYPFEIRESGGGWQFLTKGSFHKTVALLNGDKFLKRLSTAALETLAIIAYKQPITKGEIENIRGVNCDYAVQKLLEKELVIITGRKEDAPGHPLIYATSKTFMDYFGINSPEDLPKLSDIMPLDAVMPTAIGESNLVDEDIPVDDDIDNRLAVNANGEMEEIELEGEQGTEMPMEEAATGSDATEDEANAQDDEEEKQEPEA